MSPVFHCPPPLRVVISVLKKVNILCRQTCLYGFFISAAFFEMSLEAYPPDFLLVVLISLLIHVQ